MSKEELIVHAVKAVKGSVQGDVELNGRSVSVAVIGVDTPFRFLGSEEVEKVLQEIATEMEVEV